MDQQPLVASDLDRTLIYSPGALQLSMSDHDAPTLVSVEVIEGKPHSFLELSALQRLSALNDQAVFVPVTTRTVSQYRRVRFPGVKPPFAVTSNGGFILVAGKRDPEWTASVATTLADGGVPLSVVQQELAARADGDWVLKRRTADDLFTYLVVDVLALPDGFLAEWKDWCGAHGWQVSMQGRKIYSIPQGLTKEAAIAEVARRVGAPGWLAAGDGALDAGFLAGSVAGFRPPHGELHGLGWTHPGVTVGSQPGVRAADDVTRFFADHLGLVA